MEVSLKEYTTFHSPGYVIDILKDGKIEEIVYGNREIKPSIIPTDSDTLYDIASLTKTYTATLVYIAYEERKLDIYDSVKAVDNRFVNLSNVRIIDLLSHNQEIWTNGYLGNVEDEKEFYKTLFSAEVKNNFPSYIDVHYIILSTILEKIYGMSFANILQKKIFDKLGLIKTTINPQGENVASNNYEVGGDKIVDNIYPGLIHDTKARRAKELGIITGHASIFTTGRELMLFLKSFLDCSLLKEETVSLMLSHDDRNQLNLDILNGKVDSEFVRTYNYMGARYRNVIDDLNDVPNVVSDNSIVFSGFTGPMYMIDFDKKIIVVIMCNVMHRTNIDRLKRKKDTEEILNKVCSTLY